MNIDVTFAAEISNVAVKVIDHGGVVRRNCKFVLARELDELLCSGLGLPEVAASAMRALRKNDLTQVVIPLDAIPAVSARLVAPDGLECTIPFLRAVRAQGKAGVDDGEPTVKLEWAFEWSAAPWVFLGMKSDLTVTVTLLSIQREMEFPVVTQIPPALKEAADKLAAGSTRKFTGKNGKRPGASP